MKRYNGYREAFALIVGVMVFTLVVYTLEKTGVPRQFWLAVTVLFGLGVVLATLLTSGSTRAEKFLTLNRNLPTGVGALSLTALAAFPVLYLSGGAIFMFSPGFLVTLIIAVSGGMVLCGLGAYRQFNENTAADLAELVANRQQGTLAARLLAAFMAVPGVILAACGMIAGAFLLGWFLNLGATTAVGIFIFLSFLAAALGGISSLSRLGAVAAILFLFAMNLPLLIHSLNTSGFPIGHLTAGYNALEPSWELEEQLRSLNIPRITDRMDAPSAIVLWQSGNQILAAILVALGTASLPGLLQLASASHTGETAGKVLRRGLLYFALAGASLFALLAFTKIGFYQSNLGLSLSEAVVEAPYLHGWGDRENALVRVCGQAVDGPDALLGACVNGRDHILNVPDLFFESRLLLAAANEIATLPFAFTALAWLAIILCLSTFTAASALATTNMLVSAFYATLPGKVASGRVFMVRFYLLVLLGISALVAFGIIRDAGTAFMFAISLSATLGVSALVSVLHLPGSSKASLSSALGIGFAICVLYYILAHYGVDFRQGTGDEFFVHFPGMVSPLPGELGGIIALPIAIGILLLAQLLSTSTLTGIADEDEADEEVLLAEDRMKAETA